MTLERTQLLLSDPNEGLITEIRQAQIRMALAVQKTIQDGGVLAVEAGTGTGKSFSYLVPALLADKRIVIATPKKSLQDQLFNKDVPAVQRVLKKNVPCIVLKGKGNYACVQRASKHGLTPEYRAFLRSDPYGDRAHYPGPLPPWWNDATAETCVGKTCDDYDNCGYVRLRQTVEAPLPVSKVIIINHHLLGLDFLLGLGTLVGGDYGVLIVDEAHKLQDGIRSAFTYEASENSAHEIVKLTNDAKAHFRSAHNLWTISDEMFDTVQNRHWREPHERKTPVFDQERASIVMRALVALEKELDAYEEAAKGSAEAVIISLALRKTNHLKCALRVLQGMPYVGTDPEDTAMRNEFYMKNMCVYGLREYNKFIVRAAPIHLGHIVTPRFAQIPAVILTSATLAVGDSFHHLQSTIGKAPTSTDILPTMFNYEKQGVCYIPKHLPFSSRPRKNDEEGLATYNEYIQAIGDECASLVKRSRGNAFILTTANDEMEQWTKIVKAQNPRMPVFMQEFRKKDGTVVGDGSPDQILRNYMATPGSVLIGSKTFWEGVDVQGEKLILVVLPKLPFPSRSEPLIEARRRLSENAFNNVDFVDMSFDVRQGVGRLIRSLNDKGMVAILDSRIWTKYTSYGERIINLLPFPRSVITFDKQQAEWYLSKISEPKK